jgi:hypothetical protein
LDALEPGRIDALLERLSAPGSPGPVVQIRVLGGVVDQVPLDATAFAHRHRRLLVNVAVPHQSTDGVPAYEAWVVTIFDVVRGAETSACVNFLARSTSEWVHGAYPTPTYERLAVVKARYDAMNLFRLNHNIPPSSDASF